MVLAAVQSPLLEDTKHASVLVPRLCSCILMAPQHCRHVSLHPPPLPCMDPSEIIRGASLKQHCSDISTAPDSLSALSLIFGLLAEDCGLLKQLSALGPVGLPREVPSPEESMLSILLEVCHAAMRTRHVSMLKCECACRRWSTGGLTIRRTC